MFEVIASPDTVAATKMSGTMMGADYDRRPGDRPADPTCRDPRLRPCRRDTAMAWAAEVPAR